MVLVAPGAISVCRCLGWKSSSWGGGLCLVNIASCMWSVHAPS